MRSFIKAKRHSAPSENDISSPKSDTEQAGHERHSFSSIRSSTSSQPPGPHSSHVDSKTSPSLESATITKHTKTNFFQRLTKKSSTTFKSASPQASPESRQTNAGHTQKSTLASLGASAGSSLFSLPHTTHTVDSASSPRHSQDSDSISNGKKPLNLQTAYRYQRKNKSKYGTPNLSSPDDYLPAIQGTIAHEWGSPRVVRPGSPIILDKKSSTVKQGKKVEFENIERQDGDKKTDAKRKSNRLARIFSNQDFLNLSVENEEDKHLIDKLKAVSTMTTRLTIPKSMDSHRFQPHSVGIQT